ncbi:Mitochondrial Rho GTPase [Tripterygium wilfordii]|uniref:Mitochondrial Rho GTPase n=1 Tax=Tripterygium wilfordii TaxID=458696 RepID=A0A7J7DDP8_TRIWF|nr:Mitochondrial Rho GTPase [Tripterygium wilfordii]
MLRSIELTSEATEYLRGIFRLFDIDNDGALKPAELEDLFFTAPESPWVVAPYNDAAERTSLGNLSLNGFLSECSLIVGLVTVGYNTPCFPKIFEEDFSGEKMELQISSLLMR